MKHNRMKRTIAGVLAVLCVAAYAPANVGTGWLFGGTGITANAAGGTEVTKANVICQQYSYYDADNEQRNKFSLNSAPPIDIVNITLADAQAFGAAVTCPTTYWVVVYAKDGDNYKWTSNGKTGEQTSSPGSRMGAWDNLLNNDVYTFSADPMQEVTFYFSKGFDTINVSGIELNKTETTLTVGGSETLTATVSPENATDKTVTWTSDNESVATVDENGKVIAVGVGTAKITATATNGSADTTDDKTASCDVTVNSAATAFSNASVTLGDDLALNFYVDGVDGTTASDYTVNFTGACVDESSALTYNADNGKYYATTHVYAKDIDKDITATLCKGSDTVDTLEDYSITQYLASAQGEADEKTSALITATEHFGYASAEYFYGDDYGVTATFADYTPDVTAYATTFDSEAAKISLVLDSKTAARLYVKDDATGTESTVSATKADYPTYHEVTGLLPQNLADEQTITVGGTDYTFSALSWCYRVLNSTSASQKNINMAKAIMAYYTAAKNYAPVAVSSVTLDQPALTLTAEGDTATLTATVLPDNATDKTVTWSSDNEAVATVVDGVVTPVAKGTATITATAGGKSDTCVVTVNPIMYNVSLNNGGGSGTMAGSTIEKGTEYTLPANSFTAPDGLQFAGWKVNNATTVTAVGTNITVNADTTITAIWVTYTSLNVGTVLRTGDTFYTGGTVAFQTTPLMSFNASNGVITVVEATSGSSKCYKFQRGSNGTMPNVTTYKVKDNTDGVYITGGSGTSSDRFTLAVHTTD